MREPSKVQEPKLIKHLQTILGIIQWLKNSWKCSRYLRVSFFRCQSSRTCTFFKLCHYVTYYKRQFSGENELTFHTIRNGCQNFSWHPLMELDVNPPSPHLRFISNLFSQPAPSDLISPPPPPPVALPAYIVWFDRFLKLWIRAKKHWPGLMSRLCGHLFFFPFLAWVGQNVRIADRRDRRVCGEKIAILGREMRANERMGAMWIKEEYR